MYANQSYRSLDLNDMSSPWPPWSAGSWNGGIDHFEGAQAGTTLVIAHHDISRLQLPRPRTAPGHLLGRWGGGI